MSQLNVIIAVFVVLIAGVIADQGSCPASQANTKAKGPASNIVGMNVGCGTLQFQFAPCTACPSGASPVYQAALFDTKGDVADEFVTGNTTEPKYAFTDLPSKAFLAAVRIQCVKTGTETVVSGSQYGTPIGPYTPLECPHLKQKKNN